MRPGLTPILLVASALALGVARAADPPRHWAYSPPVRPSVPPVANPRWAANPIDRYILARLEREGVTPSPPADRAKLLRRVTLDLTGLPPTPAQLDSFLADTGPDAYDKVIDRLLASPAYGERWATPWLDLARYADSNGYQRDGFREIWAYRDWVIDALNSDVPYDRFTIEQIAGDLMESNVESQKSKVGKSRTFDLRPSTSDISRLIATGFHRNTTVNAEAGADVEEDRYKQVVDRVNTTGTVFLGTTLECAQCHDHKYDPIKQSEYFQLLAYFNNTPIESKVFGSASVQVVSPGLPLPRTPGQAAPIEALKANRENLKARLEHATAEKLDQARITALRGELASINRQLSVLQPTTLVMQELPEPRTTHIMKRGDYLNPGEGVRPGVPRVLHPLPADAPPNRLGLARWLASPENPLIARVAVNRWWAEFFGHGLVGTLEDFGSQGEKPSHPQLLDFLATELLRGGWSMKHIHRLIVTSSTYQQDSRLSPELLHRDPDNRLYARGPRLRLSAEAVRDHALAAAGLLSRKMHGPPVYPPQPPDVWRVTGIVDNTYRTSDGEDRYRRGLYTIRRRSGPYPSFTNFDAPDHSACTVHRARSNTPLQALTLMNDEVYVEAALALATRLIHQSPSPDPAARIDLGCRLVLSRPPRAQELRELATLYSHERRRFEADPSATARLLENRSLPEGSDPPELAAWSTIATILLNLDEAITKS